MKRNIIITALLSIFIIGAVGCAKIEQLLQEVTQPPIAAIERDVRGHEAIQQVQAILRWAREEQSPTGEKLYIAYGTGSNVPPIPLYQEITIEKNEAGNMEITSSRKVFDVVKGKEVFYGLELNYYDINGKLINHQFSGYNPKDIPNSTLPVHQHFFTLQNYALSGQPYTYPMTLDSLYIDQFVFLRNPQGQLQPSTLVSPVNVYAPKQYEAGNKLPYIGDLAIAAQTNAQSPKAKETYTHPESGKQYNLYQAMNQIDLSKCTDKVFSYQYRDTDPVEEPYGKIIYIDDLRRARKDIPVSWLKQRRVLDPLAPPDRLGLKGVLAFHYAHITFQMRICIAHIIAEKGKYDMQGRTETGGLHEYNEISPGWNSFDIDFPLPFRVIADLDDNNKEQWLNDLKRYYPNAEEKDITLAVKDQYYYPATDRIKM